MLKSDVFENLPVVPYPASLLLSTFLYLSFFKYRNFTFTRTNLLRVGIEFGLAEIVIS